MFEPDLKPQDGDEARLYAQWRVRAEAGLKGADIQSLNATTDDGLVILPLYTRSQPAPLALAQANEAVRGVPRAHGQNWIINQRLDISDVRQANAQLLNDLANGATGIILVIETPTRAGLTLKSVQDYDLLMAGVYPELVCWQLDGGENEGEALALWCAWLASKQIDPAKIRFNAALSPLAVAVRTGQMLGDADAALRLSETLHSLREAGFGGAQIWVDASPIYEAGGSEGQELAFALASAVAYLRWLVDSGWSTQEAATALSFGLTADADQFLSIAKLRAFRLLWAQLLQHCGLTQDQLPVAPLHVQTAQRMLTKRDPWVNLLRNSVAAFAAGIGGASHILVHPFNAALGCADDFARRLARNTQSILLEESQLGRVWDAAGGSFYVEHLTTDLARTAWAQFQHIEAQGGVVAALMSGTLQKQVAATLALKNEAIAQRRRPMTGVSDYALLDEDKITLAPRPDLPPPPLPKNPQAVRITPLPMVRLSAGFEALRDHADEDERTRGQRAAVLPLLVTDNAHTTKTLQFIEQFLASGGLRLLPVVPAHDFSSSNAQVLCLIIESTLEPQAGADWVAALTQTHPQPIYVAGAASAHYPLYQQAGCAGFIAPNCDAVHALTQLWQQISPAPISGT